MPVKSVPNKSSGASDNILYIHARIQTGKSRAKITDLEDKVDDFTVPLEDLPEKPDLPTQFVLDECSVIYDADNEKVLAINPYVGVFLAQGIALGPRLDGEDGEPKAKLSEPKIGNDKKEYTTKNFHEIFEIVDEDSVFYGAKPRLFLQDKFVEDENGMVGYSGTEKSKWTVRLSKFGTTQGLFDEDITWPKDGNVLPILEERLLENERQVQLVFEGGFINTLLPVVKKPVVKRPTKEVVKELGFEESTEESVDDVFPPVGDKPKDEKKSKTAKKPAKPVKDDDDSDL